MAEKASKMEDIHSKFLAEVEAVRKNHRKEERLARNLLNKDKKEEKHATRLNSIEDYQGFENGVLQKLLRKSGPPRCDFCGRFEGCDANVLMECQRCGVQIHEHCYGAKVEDFTLCRACEKPGVKRHCCLCPVEGGAMKPTDLDELWVHLTCAWFHPNVGIRETMEPVGVLGVPLVSFLKKCAICQRRTGACIQCRDCSSTYHAQCASMAGYRMELHLGKNGGQIMNAFSYCANHSSPDPNSVLIIQTPDGVLDSLKSLMQARKQGAADYRLVVITADEVEGQKFSKVLHKLKSTESQRVLLAESQISGWGIFARRTIHAGELVLEYPGVKLDGKISAIKSRDYLQQNKERYMFQVSEDVVIDATHTKSIARFINHSCFPNCRAFLRENSMVIMAITDVIAGHELTCDYLTETDESDVFASRCLCGAASCCRFVK